MTGEIERQLQELVDHSGEQKVLEALDLLVTKCRWKRLAMRCECDPSCSPLEINDSHRQMR